jgi:serine/threonine-protein kinase RsbW
MGIVGEVAGMTRDFPAELEFLLEALAFVRAAAPVAGLEQTAAARLELALEEILVNVCGYSYEPGQAGRMTLRVSGDDGEVVVEVEDTGREFTPPSLEPVARDASTLDDVPIGGLGIFLAAEMVDELIYRREGQRNIVRLVMRTAG